MHVNKSIRVAWEKTTGLRQSAGDHAGCGMVFSRRVCGLWCVSLFHSAEVLLTLLLACGQIHQAQLHHTHTHTGQIRTLLELSKLLKEMMYVQIHDNFLGNGLITSYQHTYRVGTSAGTALAQMMMIGWRAWMTGGRRGWRCRILALILMLLIIVCCLKNSNAMVLMWLLCPGWRVTCPGEAKEYSWMVAIQGQGASGWSSSG